MPTARAIPSSALRSAANMTNRLISSRSPAKTPKLPIAVNIWVKVLPSSSATSSTCCLIGVTCGSRPAAVWSIAASTSSLSFAPLSTPPRLETATIQVGGAPVSTPPRSILPNVAGETSTLRASLVVFIVRTETGDAAAWEDAIDRHRARTAVGVDVDLDPGPTSRASGKISRDGGVTTRGRGAANPGRGWRIAEAAGRLEVDADHVRVRHGSQRRTAPRQSSRRRSSRAASTPSTFEAGSDTKPAGQRTPFPGVLTRGRARRSGRDAGVPPAGSTRPSCRRQRRSR